MAVSEAARAGETAVARATTALVAQATLNRTRPAEIGGLPPATRMRTEGQ